MSLLHRLRHLLGLNHVRVVGHLDLECVTCGEIIPATEEFKETMRRLTDREVEAWTATNNAAGPDGASGTPIARR